MDAEYWKQFFTAWTPPWKPIVFGLLVLMSLSSLKSCAFGYQVDSSHAKKMQDLAARGASCAQAKNDAAKVSARSGMSSSRYIEMYCEDAGIFSRLGTGVWGLILLGFAGGLFVQRKTEVG